MLPWLAFSVLVNLGCAAEDITLSSPNSSSQEAKFRLDMTDDEVRAQISELVPVLKDPSADPIEQVEALRTWLHKFLPVADRTNNLGNQGVDHHKDKVGKMLHLAEVREGGYFCGAITEISREIFLLFGFDAISLNFQVTEGGTTHITMLVRIPQQGEEVWSVQDTYFDFTVRNPDGAYLDYGEIIDLLVEGKTNELIVDEVPDARTPALHVLRNKARMPKMSEKYDLDFQFVRDYPEFAEYMIRWDFNILLFLFSLREELETTLGTNNPLYMFAFPISTSGQDAAVAFAEKAAEAAKAMKAQVAAEPDFYQSTRVDEELEPHLTRIRNWPKDAGY